MKRALIPTVFCTLVASVSLAQEHATASETKANEERSLVERTTGTIMSADVEKKSFTVVVEEEELVLSFDADTKFLLDGKEVDAERLLQIGTRVTVVHEGDVARKVEASTEESH